MKHNCVECKPCQHGKHKSKCAECNPMGTRRMTTQLHGAQDLPTRQSETHTRARALLRRRQRRRGLCRCRCFFRHFPESADFFRDPVLCLPHLCLPPLPATSRRAAAVYESRVRCNVITLHPTRARRARGASCTTRWFPRRSRRVARASIISRARAENQNMHNHRVRAPLEFRGGPPGPYRP